MTDVIVTQLKEDFIEFSFFLETTFAFFLDKKSNKKIKALRQKTKNLIFMLKKNKSQLLNKSGHW